MLKNVSEHGYQLVSTFLDQTSWNVLWACSFPCVDLPQSPSQSGGFSSEPLFIKAGVALLAGLL